MPKAELYTSDNILLFFGSFNPIHLGHIWVAQHAREYTQIKNCWFILSPHNPFKDENFLLPFNQRLELLQEAQKDFPFIQPCAIEQNLAKPNYTCDTLQTLIKKHPQKKFFLLLGADCFLQIHLWKNFEYILKSAILVVYPRNQQITSNLNIDQKKYNILFLNHMPLYDISSSLIRENLKIKDNIKPYLPKSVLQKMFLGKQ